MILDPTLPREVIIEIHIPLTEDPFHLGDVIMTLIIPDPPVEVMTLGIPDPPVEMDMMIGDKVDMIDFRIEAIGPETTVLVTIDNESLSISRIAPEKVSPTDLMIVLHMGPELTVQTLSIGPPLDHHPLVSVGVNLTVSHSHARKKKLTVTQKNKG